MKVVHATATVIRCWLAPWPARDGWGWVRATLSAALTVEPAALLIARDAHGKPQLGGALCDWHFNLSHSGDRALLALAQGVAVGVDLELPRPRQRFMALAQRYFSASEVATLCECPEPERLRMFYALWTAKEAVLKAAGVGIAHGLARAVMRLDGGRWRPTRFGGALGPARAWHLEALALPAPLVGHLAWCGPMRQLHLVDFTV